MIAMACCEASDDPELLQEKVAGDLCTALDRYDSGADGELQPKKQVPAAFCKLHGFDMSFQGVRCHQCLEKGCGHLEKNMEHNVWVHFATYSRISCAVMYMSISRIVKKLDRLRKDCRNRVEEANDNLPRCRYYYGRIRSYDEAIGLLQEILQSKEFVSDDVRNNGCVQGPSPGSK